MSTLEAGEPAAPTERAGDSGGRRRGREVALQVLYALDLAMRGGPWGDSETEAVAASQSAFDRVTEHFEVPAVSVAFGRRLVGGVASTLDELDACIARHSKNWRVSRMAAVDRNVLRLATWELRGLDTPVAVVIDEAVDLARRFGSETSPAFVNGILDAIARELRGT
jgi:N utilization substance protein B